MILAEVARCTPESLKQNWKGLEFNETPLHQQLANEGLIVPIYKWSSGSRWLAGHVLDSAAPVPPAGEFEMALINAMAKIDRALEVTAPNWSIMDNARRDALMQLLRQTEDAAAALLARIEETWWPRDGAAEPVSAGA